MNSKNILKRYDAIIVLANLMDADGHLNSESTSRAKLSVAIFNQSNANYLVTCGWAYRDDSDIKIAGAFKDYITKTLGVRPERVIIEPNSRDTVGDAYFTKVNLAVPKGWRNICVITSNYHVARTLEIFQLIYGEEFEVDVLGVAVDTSESVTANETKSTLAFRKTFSGVERGNSIQILQCLRERHPFYNGMVYEKIQDA